MLKSSLGTLFPNESELDIYRSNFTEAAERLGRNGLYYPVTSEEVLNTDVYYEYGTPTNISYILIENPKMSLLNRFGWNVEYPDKKPIVCYLTFLDSEYKEIEPTEGCVIELTTRKNPHGGFTTDTRKFQVVEATTDFEMNMFICKLAPYRENLKPTNLVPTPEDPNFEDVYFNRKTIYSEGKDETTENWLLL